MVRLPYFDLILEARGRGEPSAALFDRFVHWGYWDPPSSADGTAEDFLAAMERLDRLVSEAAGVSDGEDVLDAGCGFGGTLAGLDARLSGVRLVGVNIDARQLEKARERVKARPGNSLRFVEADACALPFDSESFHRVLAVECIFHFPSRLRFLKEAARVLRPGGRLGLSDFVPLWPGASGPGWLERQVAEGYGTLGGWPDGGYERLAREAGLELVYDRDITRQTLPTYPFVLRQSPLCASPALAKATRILQWVSRLRVVRYRVLAFRKP